MAKKQKEENQEIIDGPEVFDIIEGVFGKKTVHFTTTNYKVDVILTGAPFFESFGPSQHNTQFTFTGKATSSPPTPYSSEKNYKSIDVIIQYNTKTKKGFLRIERLF